ncbi:hypothetical protein PJN29_27990, partial [Mycobacterium kansasii]
QQRQQLGQTLSGLCSIPFRWSEFRAEARVSGLSPATVHAVAALLDHLRDLEGLPPAGEPPIGGPVNNSD